MSVEIKKDEDDTNPELSNQNTTGADLDDDEDQGNGKKERRKIEIRFIKDKSRRHITFSKRKAGIMKKAYELSVLTGTQVLLLVVSETGLVYTFTTPKLQPLVTKPEGKNLIQACLNAPEDGGDENEEDLLQQQQQQQQQQQAQQHQQQPPQVHQQPPAQMHPGQPQMPSQSPNQAHPQPHGHYPPPGMPMAQGMNSAYQPYGYPFNDMNQNPY